MAASGASKPAPASIPARTPVKSCSPPTAAPPCSPRAERPDRCRAPFRPALRLPRHNPLQGRPRQVRFPRRLDRRRRHARGRSHRPRPPPAQTPRERPAHPRARHSGGEPQVWAARAARHSCPGAQAISTACCTPCPTSPSSPTSLRHSAEARGVCRDGRTPAHWPMPSAACSPSPGSPGRRTIPPQPPLRCRPDRAAARRRPCERSVPAQTATRLLDLLRPL